MSAVMKPSAFLPVPNQIRPAESCTIGAIAGGGAFPSLTVQIRLVPEASIRVRNPLVPIHTAPSRSRNSEFTQSSGSPPLSAVIVAMTPSVTLVRPRQAPPTHTPPDEFWVIWLTDLAGSPSRAVRCQIRLGDSRASPSPLLPIHMFPLRSRFSAEMALPSRDGCSDITVASPPCGSRCR